MVVEELDQLVVLLAEIGEVDEEPAAHVLLHALHLLRLGRPRRNKTASVR